MINYNTLAWTALSLLITSFIDRAQAAPGEVVAEWEVEEEAPPHTFIGNLRTDYFEKPPDSTRPVFDPELVKSSTFKFLPKPNQDLNVFVIDTDTGIVRTSQARIDRETYCGPIRQVWHTI